MTERREPKNDSKIDREKKNRGANQPFRAPISIFSSSAPRSDLVILHFSCFAPVIGDINHEIGEESRRFSLEEL